MCFMPELAGAGRIAAGIQGLQPLPLGGGIAAGGHQTLQPVIKTGDGRSPRAKR
jgi:hypothetical protein